jgi:hypothetical protein
MPTSLSERYRFAQKKRRIPVADKVEKLPRFERELRDAN